MINKIKICKNCALKLFIATALVSFCFYFGFISRAETENKETELELGSGMAITQENAVLSLSPVPQTEIEVTRKIRVIATAYSSTTWQTDSTPFITASGAYVQDGIIANNYLPFGTKIRIPELYGDKIFVVEDRMNWKKGNYHIDIWFQEYSEAKTFGAKNTYIEVIREI